MCHSDFPQQIQELLDSLVFLLVIEQVFWLRTFTTSLSLACMHACLILSDTSLCVLYLICQYVCLFSGISGIPGWPLTSYLMENGLELLIYLPLSPECWNRSTVPDHLVYSVLGAEKQHAGLPAW